MKGTTNVSVGYSPYTTPTDNYSFYGDDTENDSAVETDWLEAQQNAYLNFRSDTTLATLPAPYAKPLVWELQSIISEYYGSRYAVNQVGRRMTATITNTWKTTGEFFKLRLLGAQVRYNRLIAPPYTYTGQYEDYGRIQFRYSENPNLFSGGADLVTNFGTADFFVDITRLNNAARTVGLNPWASITSYIEVELDKTYIQSMVGNTLYIWAWCPYQLQSYYGSGTVYSYIYNYMRATQIATYY